MAATFYKTLVPYDRLPWGIILFCVVKDSCLCVILSVFLYNYIKSPLKSFPGPTTTKFTNLWRFLKTTNGDVHLTQMKLHRKYGPVVRMGPNTLSVSDSSVIKTVYNSTKPWIKVRFNHFNLPLRLLRLSQWWFQWNEH